MTEENPKEVGSHTGVLGKQFLPRKLNNEFMKVSRLTTTYHNSNLPSE